MLFQTITRSASLNSVHLQNPSHIKAVFIAVKWSGIGLAKGPIKRISALFFGFIFGVTKLIMDATFYGTITYFTFFQHYDQFVKHIVV